MRRCFGNASCRSKRQIVDRDRPFNSGPFRRIVQAPGRISMFYDTGAGQQWQRNIPMTTAPHLPPTIRQWCGDSRGRWEGNTLVVDVTNFSPKSAFQGAHEHLHLVERWTRLDADTIEYAATIDDPTTWVRPWTVKQELKKQSDAANRRLRCQSSRPPASDPLRPQYILGSFGILPLVAAVA